MTEKCKDKPAYQFEKFGYLDNQLVGLEIELSGSNSVNLFVQTGKPV